MGKSQALISESKLWAALQKTIDLFLPPDRFDRSKLRVVDLGCHDGGFAVEFARLGFDTLGIEIRKENFEKCQFVKSQLNLPNLRFAQDDVRNLTNYGNFDIAFCFGILYHLDDPVAFLKNLSNHTQKILLLNTHYSRKNDLIYDIPLLAKYVLPPLEKRVKMFRFRHNYHLSKLSENEGYQGRWYKEWNQDASQDTIEKRRWASYNNYQSFWLCKSELTRVLRDVEFKHVFEQFDYTGDLAPQHYGERFDRGIFVALKSSVS